MEEIVKKLEDIREIQRILKKILVIKIKSKSGLIIYKPIKNCTKQDCYKALYDINRLVGFGKWGNFMNRDAENSDEYILKKTIKNKYLELCYEQEEGKNIVENKYKIEILEEILGKGDD